MKLLRAFLPALLLCLALAGPLLAQSPVQGAFAAKLQEATKLHAAAVAGAKGWLFLTSELRFLSLPTFWGEAAAQVSKASKPDLADPIPAIVDFQKQLKARGVEMLLVPVPPKASLYPWNLGLSLPPVSSATDLVHPPLARFYQELAAQGVKVLDLTEPMAQAILAHNREYYCHTDSHWTSEGAGFAADAIARRLFAEFGIPRKEGDVYTETYADAEIQGDLVPLLPPGTPKPAPEKVKLRQVKHAATGAPVVADPESPVLLLGDSHTLVFHEFAGERAGLLDQLALQLKFAPDLIGTRGSGSTAVRLSLYRKSLKEPDYLRKKKVVVWCFTAREFSESEQGWSKLPVAK